MSYLKRLEALLKQNGQDSLVQYNVEDKQAQSAARMHSIQLY